MFWPTLFIVLKHFIFWFALVYGFSASMGKIFDKNGRIGLNVWPYVTICLVCIVIMAFAVQ